MKSGTIFEVLLESGRSDGVKAAKVAAKLIFFPANSHQRLPSLDPADPLGQGITDDWV